MVRHIILPTPVICNRLQLWYTPKRTKGHPWHFDLIQTAKAHSRHNERTRISPAAKQESFKTADLPILSEWYLPGGRIWSSFSLGPIPCVIPLHTTQNTPAKHSTLANILQAYKQNASTTHSIAYYLLPIEQGATPCPPPTLRQTIAQANARRITNLCWSIAPTLTISKLPNLYFVCRELIIDKRQIYRKTITLTNIVL